MSDRKFTLIELHLDGDQLWPRSLGDVIAGSDNGESQPAHTAEESTDEESGGPGAIGAGVALLVLVAIGVAVKKYRGGEEPDEDTDDQQPDVIVN